jgi:tetratricopeptide (TPR) repeat protein
VEAELLLVSGLTGLRADPEAPLEPRCRAVERLARLHAPPAGAAGASPQEGWAREFTSGFDAHGKEHFARLLLACAPDDPIQVANALEVALAAERMAGEADARLLETLALAHLRADQGTQAIRYLSMLPEAPSPERARAEAAFRDPAGDLVGRGVALNREGRYADAEPLLRECLEMRREILSPDDWRISNAMSNLGESLVGQGRYAEAKPLLVEGYESMVPSARRDQRLGEALERLVNLYDSWGKPDRAAEWKAAMENLSIEPFRRRAERANAVAGTKNGYAWQLLTVVPADLQDPEEALRFAVQANEMTDFRETDYLDTLALAYHRTGDTRKAVATQRKALALLPEGDGTRGEFEKRLGEYEATLRDQQE